MHSYFCVNGFPFSVNGNHIYEFLNLGIKNSFLAFMQSNFEFCTALGIHIPLENLFNRHGVRPAGSQPCTDVWRPN
jgi:hypothetical protein